ncbi:BACON domain-containing protein, partial [Gracilimonas amylolytica]|uniref:BACON domain-containing protein n=1 Tax=Gracilimonas amylolytica TaxID=1749045 RepID=UPI0018E4C0C5
MEGEQVKEKNVVNDSNMKYLLVTLTFLTVSIPSFAQEKVVRENQKIIRTDSSRIDGNKEIITTSSKYNSSSSAARNYIFNENFEGFTSENWYIGEVSTDSDVQWGAVREGVDSETNADFIDAAYSGGSNYMYVAGNGFTRDPFSTDPIYDNYMDTYFSYKYWINGSFLSGKKVDLYYLVNVPGIANNDEMSVWLVYEGGERQAIDFWNSVTSGWLSATYSLDEYIDERRFYIEFVFESNWTNRDIGVFIDNVQLYYEEDASITASPTSLSFSSASGSDDFAITSNVSSWTVSESLAWVTVSGADGSGNDSQVLVSVDQNTSTNSRNGTITISGGGTSETVSVSQAG